MSSDAGSRQGCHFGCQARAEAGRQPRQQPIRNFQPHRIRHRRDGRACGPSIRDSTRVFRPGTAAARRTGRRRRPARRRTCVQPSSSSDAATSRRGDCLRIAQPPAQPPASAQHAPDAVRHGAAVARADIAARPEEIVGDGVGGSFRRALDDLQQIDRGGDSRGGGQAGRSGDADRSGTSVTVGWDKRGEYKGRSDTPSDRSWPRQSAPRIAYMVPPRHRAAALVAAALVAAALVIVSRRSHRPEPTGRAATARLRRRQYNPRVPSGS